MELKQQKPQKGRKKKFFIFYTVKDISHDVFSFNFLRREIEKVINNNIYAAEWFFYRKEY